MERILHPRRRLAITVSALLYVLALLALTVILPSCQHDDVVAPAGSTAVADDHGGHGNDDPPGDDHGHD